MLLRVIDYISIVMEKKARQTDDQSDDQLVVFFREFLKVITIIVCVLVLIRFVFHQDITKLLAGLSIAGAAIALAAKESIENLIASFIIFFDKPFTVGDFLKVNTVRGNVEKIGLRSTRIRTIDRTYATIPNKQMVDAIVDNLSLRNSWRVEMKLNIELKASSEMIKNFVAQLASNLESFELTDKTVILADIHADAYIVNVEYYTVMLTFAEYNKVKQSINFMIVETMEKNALSMAGKDKLVSVR
jgi:MscS family membrane protein